MAVFTSIEVIHRTSGGSVRIVEKIIIECFFLLLFRDSAHRGSDDDDDPRHFELLLAVVVAFGSPPLTIIRPSFSD